MEPARQRISIIDANEDIRQDLTVLINSLSKHKVVAVYENCEMAIKRLHFDFPDIILMDLNFPDMLGLEAIKAIKKRMPAAKIIIVTDTENSDLVFKSLVAGAIGYITKSTSSNQILDSIDELALGGAPLSTSIARLVVESFHRNKNSPLTPRETIILDMLSKGKTHTAIATELFIHKETVKSHTKNIYLKLQVNSKADAIEKAMKNKLI